MLHEKCDGQLCPSRTCELFVARAVNWEIWAMPRKLKLVKGRMPKSALVYGMRIFNEGEIAGVEDARVNLADGNSGRIAMHLIEGTRTQIRRQLIQSIDAFFDLLDEETS